VPNPTAIVKVLNAPQFQGAHLDTATAIVSHDASEFRHFLENKEINQQTNMVPGELGTYVRACQPRRLTICEWEETIR
jgi:hypothetical protein